MYGLDMLRLLDGKQAEDIAMQGIGTPIDWERAAEDGAYVLEIFDAAPIQMLHDIVGLSGSDVDWKQLVEDAGDGPVIQQWQEEEADTEAQRLEAEAQDAADGA